MATTTKTELQHSYEWRAEEIARARRELQAQIKHINKAFVEEVLEANKTRTVREIAQEIGVTEGLLWRHIRNYRKG